ncbi:MAG: biopolymer transporter ExbD [Arenicella sp.]|nr:biopolymer transporter ExbD [Arenicella sp.]
MNFDVAQHEDETGIELTPLIDVVFLLLIFFMISTTFTKETSLRINLPEASGEEAVNQPRTIEVHVGAGSEYAVAVGDGVARALVNSNRETLLRALSKFPSANSDLLLVIRADKEATHESVIKVLDVAQEIGMSNITFATKRSTD